MTFSDFGTAVGEAAGRALVGSHLSDEVAALPASIDPADYIRMRVALRLIAEAGPDADRDYNRRVAETALNP